MSFQGSESLIWLGIVFCVSQSALFSGMNLAMFSLSRLRLEIEVSSGSKAAGKVLAMRTDSNFLLTTILWGNVGVNVLLTLLSDSVLAGISAFIFSTVVITMFGEIMPQAYFSRNALKVASYLAPVLRFYQFLLYPLAKPFALLLDAWLGKEGVHYYREHDLRELIQRHIDSPEAESIDRLEGLGALNFLSIDDLPIVSEGRPVDLDSVVVLDWQGDDPVFPNFTASIDDSFLGAIDKSGKKWVILTDAQDNPRLVLDADGFLRHVFLHPTTTEPLAFCHRPVVVTSSKKPLGWVLSRLKYAAPSKADKVIVDDVVLLWADTKRVITGADILGKLLDGIADKRVTQKAN